MVNAQKNSNKNEVEGKIIRITGPVVVAEGVKNAKMYDVVKVGELGLIGEIIGIDGEKSTIQVYEETGGISPGEIVKNTFMPLSVELGPGLLKSIYDGIQRPLDIIKDQVGDFISRGVSAYALDRKKKWDFTPTVKKGDAVATGDIIGTVKETDVVEHRVLVPEGISGKVEKIEAGSFTVEQPIAVIGGKEVIMLRKWPVRVPRRVVEKLKPDTPLITGQRIIDCLFPIAKGGTAAIPGPFGSGKTVTQHQLAKWADADIIVYIGCGERGNEMTEVLTEFPKLIDPKSQKPLMERTILIANTSNMPVAAREASVYTGITLAEYYRDMGYDVAVMADSTSRWAEAMREISGRLGEMPGEEGFPAYLSARISEFYERAGHTICLGSDKRMGSISIIGAVSPPGGDFSEPVTQSTLRVVRAFWALDAKLAYRRHFPAINWLQSYTLYMDSLTNWFTEKVKKDWVSLRQEAMNLFQKEAELQEIVQLVGPDALPEHERLVLESARMLREDFLQQSAYHEVDTYSTIEKQYDLLKLILTFHENASKGLAGGLPFSAIQAGRGAEIKDRIAKLKYTPDDKFNKEIQQLSETIKTAFASQAGGLQ